VVLANAQLYAARSAAASTAGSMIGSRCAIALSMIVTPKQKALPARRSFRTATQQYVLLSGMGGYVRRPVANFKATG
jgi:hypothetical protein